MLIFFALVIEQFDVLGIFNDVRQHITHKVTSIEMHGLILKN